MSVSKAQKEKTLQELTEAFQKAKSLSFSNYRGLKVKEINELKKKLKQEKTGYKVAKKTLINLALKNAGQPEVSAKTFDGPVAVGIGYEDEIAPFKSIHTFAKEHKFLELLGGILQGEFFGKEKAIALAGLPNKTQLLAQVVGGLKSPLYGLANVLSGNLRGFLQVLKGIQK